MNHMATTAATGRFPRPWQVWCGVLVAAAGCAWFLRRDAIHYLTLDPQEYTEYYWPRRYALLLHVVAGMTALVVGLAQVYMGVSGRTRASHRWLGRIYVLAVSVGSACAFYLAATIPLSLYSTGLFGLGSAWIVTTALAYYFVRHGALTRHRAWMLRSYVVTFGFVSLRVIQLILMSVGGLDEDTSVGIAAWLCWVIPLPLVEILLRSRRWPILTPALS